MTTAEPKLQVGTVDTVLLVEIFASSAPADDQAVVWALIGGSGASRGRAACAPQSVHWRHFALAIVMMDEGEFFQAESGVAEQKAQHQLAEESPFLQGRYLDSALAPQFVDQGGNSQVGWPDSFMVSVQFAQAPLNIGLGSRRTLATAGVTDKRDP